MSWLEPEWMQGGIDALRATLNVDGAMKRDMIQFLLDEGFWDSERLSWDAAVARFNACLNPSKAEFFKVGEVWALMKRFDRHELAIEMLEDLGYEVRRRPTEQRRQDLLARIAGSLDRNERELAAARAELARMDDTIQPRRLHPSVVDGAGRFCRPEGGF